MALLLSLFIMTTSFGNEFPTKPDKLTWCAAMLAGAEAGQRGADVGAMNEAYGRFRKVTSTDRKNVPKWFERWTNWLAGRTAAGTFNVTFGNAGDPAETRGSMVEAKAALIRLERLELDVTGLHDDTIAVAHVIRGQENIDTYVRRVDEISAEMTKFNALGTQQTYRQTKRWFAPLVRGLIYTMASYVSIDGALHHLPPNAVDMLPFHASALAIFAPAAVHHVRRLVSYVRGVLNPTFRGSYEDAYDPNRRHDLTPRLKTVAGPTPKAINPLAFASYEFETTNDDVDRILRASGVPPATPGAADAFDPVRRPVSIDLISFDDGEPLLLTFWRIKRPPRRGNKSPRRPAGRRLPGFTPGGLAPAGT